MSNQGKRLRVHVDVSGAPIGVLVKLDRERRIIEFECKVSFNDLVCDDHKHGSFHGWFEMCDQPNPERLGKAFCKTFERLAKDAKQVKVGYFVY